MMEIHVEGLCKAYGGRPVLTGLSAVFRPGITCVAAPDGGIIRGADCRWAAVFQEDRLLENLSAAANLRFALGEVSGEVEKLLARLGLELSDARPVRAWSGGMRRRLALARALLAPAEALALDEPFTGLDGENRARCVALIREREGGRPVLLATHDLTGLEDAPVVRLGEK